jgi:hypothetical protein
MAHAQKPDYLFRRNRRVHLNRQGCQFSLLLAGELYTSACRVCTARASLCSVVTWRLLATHSILLFPLHFSSRASPCAITFHTQSTTDPLPIQNSKTKEFLDKSIENWLKFVSSCDGWNMKRISVSCDKRNKYHIKAHDYTTRENRDTRSGANSDTFPHKPMCTRKTNLKNEKFYLKGTGIFS